MKRLFVLFIILYAYIGVLCAQKDVKSIQIVYSPLDYNTKMPCEPLLFDLGAKEDFCDTIEISNKEDINMIINCFNGLRLSKHNAIETCGKLLIKYDKVIPEQTWIYWGPAEFQMGLNGNIYNLTIQFADVMNKIFQKYSKETYFEQLWYEWINSSFGFRI